MLNRAQARYDPEIFYPDPPDRANRRGEKLVNDMKAFRESMKDYRKEPARDQDFHNKQHLVPKPFNAKRPRLLDQVNVLEPKGTTVQPVVDAREPLVDGAPSSALEDLNQSIYESLHKSLRAAEQVDELRANLLAKSTALPPGKEGALPALERISWEVFEDLLKYLRSQDVDIEVLQLLHDQDMEQWESSSGLVPDYFDALERILEERRSSRGKSHGVLVDTNEEDEVVIKGLSASRRPKELSFAEELLGFEVMKRRHERETREHPHMQRLREDVPQVVAESSQRALNKAAHRQEYENGLSCRLEALRAAFTVVSLQPDSEDAKRAHDRLMLELIEYRSKSRDHDDLSRSSSRKAVKIESLLQPDDELKASPSAALLPDVPQDFFQPWDGDAPLHVLQPDRPTPEPPISGPIHDAALAQPDSGRSNKYVIDISSSTNKTSSTSKIQSSDGGSRCWKNKECTLHGPALGSDRKHRNMSLFGLGKKIARGLSNVAQSMNSGNRDTKATAAPPNKGASHELNDFENDAGKSLSKREGKRPVGRDGLVAAASNASLAQSERASTYYTADEHLPSQYGHIDEHATPCAQARSRQENIQEDEYATRKTLLAANAEQTFKDYEISLLTECVCCGDAKSTADAFSPHPPTYACEHQSQTCRECMDRWLASELKGKGCKSLHCPECLKVMEYEDVLRGASKETTDEYEKRLFLMVLSEEPEFSWCLSAKCNFGQLNLENGHYMDCASCRYKQCLQHKSPWHDGETCEAYDKRVKSVDAAEVATKAMIDAVSKTCPGRGCEWRIQKADGCDHITCVKCQHQFCWLCMADFKTIKVVGNTAHTKDCKYHSHNLEVTWPFNVHN